MLFNEICEKLATHTQEPYAMTSRVYKLYKPSRPKKLVSEAKNVRKPPNKSFNLTQKPKSPATINIEYETCLFMQKGNKV